MTRYSVWVKTKAKQEGVSVREDGDLEVAVNAAPEKGRANARMLELVAEHLGVARSRVHIVMGHASRRKVIEVL